MGSAGKGFFLDSSLPFRKSPSLKMCLRSKRSESYISNPPPIDYSVEMRDYLNEEFFCNADAGVLPLRNRSIRAEEPLRSNIRKLYISLDAYIESSNPVEKYTSILHRVLEGPDGIVKQKRIRLKSFTYSANLSMIEEPEWWNDVLYFPIKDVGDIFNFQYMFNWVMPDENDYLHGHIPLSIKREVLDELKESLRSRLPDRVRFHRINENEILLSQTSSTNLNPITLENSKNWILKGQFPRFASNGLTGKRLRIQTSPGVFRDSVLLPIDQLNTVNLIDRQVNSIIQHMWGNGMVRDINQFRSMIEKDAYDYTFFINRDIKKEGITKPREILKALLEVLDEEYPDLGLSRYSGIYNSFTLIHEDGRREEMERGHGLGMANSLTTLMQMAVFYMIIDRVQSESRHKRKDFEFKAYNDDFYAAFSSKELGELYWDYEESAFEDLGLLREPRKSFQGGYPILCESYPKSFNYKESYCRREILNSLCVMNIVQAKALISSLTRSINEDYLDEYYGEIMTYWGHEFHPVEQLLPARLGGWKNYTGRGVSFDLLQLNDDLPNLKPYFEAAKLVSIRVDKFKLPKEQNYTAPITYLFNIREGDFGDETPSMFNLGEFKQISKKFVKTSEDYERSLRSWNDLKVRRQTVFGENRNIFRNNGQIEREVIDYYDMIDFVPNYTKLKDVEIYPAGFSLAEATEEFLFENPTMSFLKYIFPDKISDDVFPNPIPNLFGSRSINLTDATWIRRTEKYIGARSRIDFLDLNKNAFFIPKELENAFISPRFYISVCEAMSYTTVPVPGYIPETKIEKMKVLQEFRIPDAIISNFQSLPYLVKREIHKYIKPDEVEHYVQFIWELLKEWSARINPPPEPVVRKNVQTARTEAEITEIYNKLISFKSFLLKKDEFETKTDKEKILCVIDNEVPSHHTYWVNARRLYMKVWLSRMNSLSSYENVYSEDEIILRDELISKGFDYFKEVDEDQSDSSDGPVGFDWDEF
jgi:hypothetical protein